MSTTKFRVKSVDMPARVVYLNTKEGNTVETVDCVISTDFEYYGDFKKEVRDVVTNYHQCGMYVYRSKRCTNDWKNKD